MSVAPLQYGYGPGSPLAKLNEAGGQVLLLGAPLDTITLFHHAEHLARIPGKRVVRYRMPILRDGRRVWVDVEEFDTAAGVVDRERTEGYGYFFANVAREFLIGVW